MARRIALIGCGKMGSALLRSWIEAKIDAAFTVIDPGLDEATTLADLLPTSSKIPSPTTSSKTPSPKASPLPSSHYVKLYRDVSEAQTDLQNADTIILAIKPQIMEDACAALKAQISKDTLILSIAAGQSLSNYESYLSPAQPIIRAMPNTPAAIGKGMTVATANNAATAEHKARATTLLSTTGKLEWVEDETLMNAVTALSGSGPAYIFYLIEALAKAGQHIGLAPDMAMTLARQTVIGASALAEQDTDTPAATLRENVTSPGGTTEAALETLMNGNVQDILNNALSAAKKRSEELG